ncbi:MAG: DEAD/DEAH box helicase [Verrucomicrobia bacterium]|nr:DEAD/DEAH box helicase [Verrucomicrobiota bacterium]MCH8511310.1 DEAD/DEAH box helicase [Kiritimatiellia bacterium]
MTPSVGVRELAAFAGRSGDLGSDHFSLLRGVDGIRAHRRMQNDRGPGFQAEVTLRTTWEGPAGPLDLQGRADGIEQTPDGPVIEEIKTTRAPEGEKPLDYPVHRLQALIYAWMWWKLEGVCPRFRVRYLPPERGDGWCLEETLSPDQLAREVDAAATDYLQWRQAADAWTTRRNATLADLAFPYPETRPGQDELMAAATQTLSQGGRLYAEAPTGVGKTLAVLIPALRALGRGHCETVFVATCRNSGKTMFTDALQTLMDQGAEIRSLTLVAKDRVCRNNGTPCDCSACPLAIGFYDRLNAALADWREQAPKDTDAWQRVAETHRLCPFAFMMHAAREADLLIGDVNYALDPTARLHFLFGTKPETTALLIDEAHHLPERSREMHSAELDLAEIGKILRGLSPNLRGLSPHLRRVQRAAREVELFDGITETPPRELAEACRRAAEAIDFSYGACPRLADDPRPALSRVLRGFWLGVERHRPAHVVYRDGQVLHHFCRDAAEPVGTDLEALHAAILFSATLRPLRLFRQMTGSTPQDRELLLPSPFDPERFPLSLETDIPVVYRARGPATYDRLAARIRQFLEAQPGKTLVYLPSFEILEEICKRLPTDDLWLGPILAQPRGLQEAESVTFLKPFREDGGPVTALAVLGGALNEGIDLPGDALTGVVVVSIGLPAVIPRREILRNYHQARGEDGFVVAYTFPGLLRVLQALGRVIRGPEDRGRALLIDPRFEHPFYREFLGPF